MQLKFFYLVLTAFALVFLSACEEEGSDRHLAELMQGSYNLEETPEIQFRTKLNDDLLVVGAQVEPEYFAFDFVDIASERYTRGASIRASDDDIVLGSNWGLTLAEIRDGAMTGNSSDFSIVYGRVPFGGFQSVEISWNCQEPEAQVLSEGGYFFFSKPMHNMRRCNDIYLYREDGERVLIERDAETGRFITP